MSRVIRRKFIKTIGTGLAASMVPGLIHNGHTKVQTINNDRNKNIPVRVRDKLWLWGHAAGSHNVGWNLPGPSRMTPAEAAYYMGVPNLIMVTFANKPAPPFDIYARALSPLKQVVWSIVGDSSSKRNDKSSDIEHVIKLADSFPNITGAMMDDFFHDKDTVARYSLEDSAKFTQKLHNAAHPLDLWVVLYAHQLDLPVQEHLKLCDKVTFWTWEANNLKNLEDNFSRMEHVVPDNCQKVLGCYMWDYGRKQPMPVAAMQHQCDTGLRRLQEGRIDGMIFLASCICDLELESVEWTRHWIQKIGDTVL